jgi:hypothetical protein
MEIVDGDKPLSVAVVWYVYRDQVIRQSNQFPSCPNPYRRLPVGLAVGHRPCATGLERGDCEMCVPVGNAILLRPPPPVVSFRMLDTAPRAERTRTCGQRLHLFSSRTYKKYREAKMNRSRTGKAISDASCRSPPHTRLECLAQDDTLHERVLYTKRSPRVHDASHCKPCAGATFGRCRPV